jgi:hypothetical protein
VQLYKKIAGVLLYLLHVYRDAGIKLPVQNARKQWKLSDWRIAYNLISVNGKSDIFTVSVC